jgi:uncharacterized protein (DUF983 family)
MLKNRSIRQKATVVKTAAFYFEKIFETLIQSIVNFHLRRKNPVWGHLQVWIPPAEIHPTT